LSNLPRAIVVNNDHPESSYGAGRLASAFAAAFETEIIIPSDNPGRLLDRISSHSVDVLVLSGSDRSVLEEDGWMLAQEDLLRETVRLGFPTLAICFGHQLLGKALGATIVTDVKRVGLFEVTPVARDPVFAGVGASALVPEQHSDQIEGVPEGFELIATSHYCAVQAIRHCRAPVYGMQFHPCYGGDVFEADEEWAELGYEGSFEHDGGLILGNTVRVIAGALGR
jgi:GMP synthase-like glutamine amidotransferase